MAVDSKRPVKESLTELSEEEAQMTRKRDRSESLSMAEVKRAFEESRRTGEYVQVGNCQIKDFSPEESIARFGGGSLVFARQQPTTSKTPATDEPLDSPPPHEQKRMSKPRRKRSRQRYSFPDDTPTVLMLPDVWQGLTEDELKSFVAATIVLYVTVLDTRVLEQLKLLYPHFASRIQPEDRHEMYVYFRDQVDENQLSAMTLGLFARFDVEPYIVSTAALDYCMLRPRGQDELAGPKEMLEVFDGNWSRSPVGIFGGLLNLGDRRVTKLLWERRLKLSREERKVLSWLCTGYLFAATIEFFLEWLEECPGDAEAKYMDGVAGEYWGSLAGALFRMAEDAQTDVVQDIRRHFPRPEWPAPSSEVLHEWPVSEYCETVLAPRLRRIAKREGEPRVLPDVMAAWGIENDEKDA